MNDIIIEGIDDLYSKLLAVGCGNEYGPITSFFVKARTMKDPNTCSCKKGKKAQDELLRMYMNLPSQIRSEPNLGNAKKLLGGSVLIFKISGTEFARIG